MKVLLLNAGSSSLKCTLMEPEQFRTVASSLTDWGGSATRYRYSLANGKQHDEEVSWNGHAEAVRRTLCDMTHIDPIALPDRSALAAAAHRVVHGGKFTTSVTITSEVRAQIS